MAYTTVSFGGETLEVVNIVPRQVPSTLKYKVGKRLVKVPVPTRDAWDWELRISGIIITNLDTNRTNLEALNDVEKHAYSDGLRSGNFIIEPGTLVFEDDQNDAGQIYRYEMTLTEYNQT